MRKLFFSLVTLIALVAFGVATAEAASSAPISVTVTMTAGALDVSVTPGTWAIGSISESATPNTIGIGPNYFTATNNRTNATEDLTLTVASSAGWTAAGTAGANQFAMQFSTAGITPIWTTIAVPAGSLLADDLGISASEMFDLQLLAPTSTTVGGTQQTIAVTVTAS